ncbi:MAG: signal peptidase II [Spirochaetes bacterium RBG_16_49_21]|nr:MAG: signal peptidase II [Spirochaetes bacterium RBG_16_49_21]
MKKDKIKTVLVPLLIIVAVVSLDIMTKYMIVARFDDRPGGRIDFLGGLVRIALVYNDGFVFGLGQGYKNVALAISIVVLTLMITYYLFEKNKSSLFSISMGLITSGALGNIVDRVIPGRPGVVDFISIGVDGVYRWPSFNVADSSIVVGAVLLIIVFYREENKRKKQASG